MEVVSIIPLIVIIIFLAVRCYEYHLKTRLLEQVAWCVGGYSIEDIRHAPLLDVICNIQNKHNMPKEHCRIEEAEQTTVKEVLRYYQEYLMQTFFRGNLTFNRKIARMTSEAYFLYTLKWFLDNHDWRKYSFENPTYKTVCDKFLYTVRFYFSNVYASKK